MEISELIKKAHENSKNHGFWDDVNLENEGGLKFAFSGEYELETEEINAIGNRLMLIVGEVAEAQEGLRRDDRNNFREELADVAIRLADLCGGLQIDLEAEIIKKMERNKDRPYKHGKQF